MRSFSLLSQMQVTGRDCFLLSSGLHVENWTLCVCKYANQSLKSGANTPRGCEGERIDSSSWLERGPDVPHVFPNMTPNSDPGKHRGALREQKEFATLFIVAADCERTAAVACDAVGQKLETAVKIQMAPRRSGGRRDLNGDDVQMTPMNLCSPGDM